MGRSLKRSVIDWNWVGQIIPLSLELFFVASFKRARAFVSNVDRSAHRTRFPIDAPVGTAMVTDTLIKDGPDDWRGVYWYKSIR